MNETKRQIKTLHEWQKEVKRLDCNKCIFCGKTEPKMYAHHIAQRHSSPSRQYDLSNGVTLCGLHHRYIHGTVGPYTEENAERSPLARRMKQFAQSYVDSGRAIVPPKDIFDTPRTERK